MAKTAEQYLNDAELEYVGSGTWRVDLVDALNISIDVSAAEGAARDDVRAAAAPTLQSVLDRRAEDAES